MANKFLKQDWIEVWLGRRDLALADELATKFCAYHRREGRPDAFNMPGTDDDKLRQAKFGIRGQFAYSVWVRGGYEKFRTQDFWSVKRKTPDHVHGKYHVDVRTTTPAKALRIHDSDPDGRLMVKVESVWPEDYFTIRYWCYARDGKEKKYASDGEGGTRPCYFVPDCDLRDANHMLTYPPVLAGQVRT